MRRLETAQGRTRFWAYGVIDPIKSPDGTIIGFVKIARDQTERRKAEEELRRSQEQFRLLVGPRNRTPPAWSETGRPAEPISSSLG
jgi:hypothetical protein